MKDQRKQNPQPDGAKDDAKLPGDYPPQEDIFNRAQRADVDPETKKPVKDTPVPQGRNEKNPDNAFDGGELDVPGSEDDDDMEDIGSEDEENNYYSLGGDNHDDDDNNNTDLIN